MRIVLALCTLTTLVHASKTEDAQLKRAQVERRGKLLTTQVGVAADLRAPNAQIARVRSEERARRIAVERFTAALAVLKRDADDTDEKMQITGEGDYGSDGSVRLSYQLEIERMPKKKVPVKHAKEPARTEPAPTEDEE